MNLVSLHIHFFINWGVVKRFASGIGTLVQVEAWISLLLVKVLAPIWFHIIRFHWVETLILICDVFLHVFIDWTLIQQGYLTVEEWIVPLSWWYLMPQACIVFLLITLIFFLYYALGSTTEFHILRLPKALLRRRFEAFPFLRLHVVLGIILSF